MSHQAAAAHLLKNRALRFLAQREHSRSELRARLLRMAQRYPHVVDPEKTPGRSQVFSSPSGGLAHSDRFGGSHEITPGRSQVFSSPSGGLKPSGRLEDSTESAADGAEVVERMSAEQLQAVVDAVLDELQLKGYLSDERFVASRIRIRQARWGAQRIQTELGVHGLVLSDVQKQELQQSELERAQAVWARKFGEVRRQPQQYAKQARFLVSRGFGSDVIRQVLRAADSVAGAELDEADGGRGLGQK